MKNKTIRELLVNKDLYLEDSLAIFSGYIWEIADGNINKIRDKITDDCFDLYVISNTIGNFRAGGWRSIVLNQTSFLPYIPKAMKRMGLETIAHTTEELTSFIKPYTLTSDWDDDMSSSTYNFLIGYDYEDHRKDSCKLNEKEREDLTNTFNNYIDSLDKACNLIWGYERPDQEGWGFALRLLNEIADTKFMK